MLIFLYLKTIIYGKLPLWNNSSIEIHPAGKNNSNASSKSPTTPHDRWVQALLLPSRDKKRWPPRRDPQECPDAAKLHRRWNNWSRCITKCLYEYLEVHEAIILSLHWCRLHAQIFDHRCRWSSGTRHWRVLRGFGDRTLPMIANHRTQGLPVFHRAVVFFESTVTISISTIYTN